MFNLVNYLFSRRCPTKRLQTFVISPARVIRPAHIISLDYTSTLILVWIPKEKIPATQGRALHLYGILGV
jgi:hypothetical protein